MNQSDNQKILFSTLSESSSRIDDVRYGKDNNIIFLTKSDGRGAIHQAPSVAIAECSDYNIRGTVAYGGGAFDIRNNTIAFCEKDGAVYLYENTQNENPRRIVPPFLKTSTPRISPDGKWVLFVFEHQETNGVGIVSSHRYTWPRQLVMGADFYMQPTWHPDGNMVAWVEWDLPDMPWDASRIKLGQLSGMQVRLCEASFIDGFPKQSANQPLFSPDGKYLSYVVRNNNWDDLILFNLKTQQKIVLVSADGFHLRMPDWIQGLHSYQWTPNSKKIYYIMYHQGTASIASVDIKTGERTAVVCDPYIWFSQLDISPDGKEACTIGLTAYSGDEIVRVDLTENKIKPSDQRANQQNEAYPLSVEFINSNNSTGYAWFYPAPSQDTNKPAPCIIKLHSGPTSLKHAGYSPETEFFRLNGFSVAHLNYRGSVSFGYDYQDALEKRWGDVEVEDMLDLVETLVAKGLIDRNRLAVIGSSAGGFSVLQILIKHPGLCNAAICSYAVSDLVDDAENTHKFEKFYHRFLTGNYPQEKTRFIQRSPINHIDKISDPIAIFHGENDPVVSVHQSQLIFEKLQKNGVPCSLTIFEEEGHGFRKSENLEHYYQTILDFLRSYL